MKDWKRKTHIRETVCDQKTSKYILFFNSSFVFFLKKTMGLVIKVNYISYHHSYLLILKRETVKYRP